MLSNQDTQDTYTDLHRIFNPTIETINQQVIDYQNANNNFKPTQLFKTRMKQQWNKAIAAEYFGTFSSDPNLDADKFIREISNNINYDTWHILSENIYNFIEETIIKTFSKEQKKILNYFWIFQCKKCFYWDTNREDVLNEPNKLLWCGYCAYDKEVKKISSRIKIVDHTNIDEIQEFCSICYDDYNKDSRPIGKMPCGHLFHKSCVLNWIDHNPNCPCCRTVINAKKYKPDSKKQKKSKKKKSHK